MDSLHGKTNSINSPIRTGSYIHHFLADEIPGKMFLLRNNGATRNRPENRLTQGFSGRYKACHRGFLWPHYGTKGDNT
jgi:hypothetical protein